MVLDVKTHGDTHEQQLIIDTYRDESCVDVTEHTIADTFFVVVAGDENTHITALVNNHQQHVLVKE